MARHIMNIFEHDLAYMLDNGWENTNSQTLEKSLNYYEKLRIQPFSVGENKFFKINIVLSDEFYGIAPYNIISRIAKTQNINIFDELEVFRCFSPKIADILLKEYFNPGDLTENKKNIGYFLPEKDKFVEYGVYNPPSFKNNQYCQDDNLSGYITYFDNSKIKWIPEGNYVVSSSLEGDKGTLESLFWIHAKQPTEDPHIVAEQDLLPDPEDQKIQNIILSLRRLISLDKKQSIKMAMQACDLSVDYLKYLDDKDDMKPEHA